MSKVTSKYQLTMPKKIADRYAIRPGDEIQWVPAGDVIRIIPPGTRTVELDKESRLRLFDQATKREQKRATALLKRPAVRGWTRDDLYDRGHSN